MKSNLFPSLQKQNAAPAPCKVGVRVRMAQPPPHCHQCRRTGIISFVYVLMKNFWKHIDCKLACLMQFLASEKSSFVSAACDAPVFLGTTGLCDQIKRRFTQTTPLTPIEAFLSFKSFSFSPPAPTCSGFTGCVSSQVLMNNPTSKTCAAATCTTSECCVSGFASCFSSSFFAA